MVRDKTDLKLETSGMSVCMSKFHQIF